MLLVDDSDSMRSRTEAFSIPGVVDKSGFDAFCGSDGEDAGYDAGAHAG